MVSRLRSTAPRHWCTVMGFLHSQVLWLWSHYSDSFHTCKVDENDSNVVVKLTLDLQLLAPAADALTDPCLTGPITEYDWAEGICLMAIFILFFVELMTMRYAKFGHSHEHDVEDQGTPAPYTASDRHQHRTSHGAANEGSKLVHASEIPLEQSRSHAGPSEPRRSSVHVPGDDHFSHEHDHTDNEDVPSGWESNDHSSAEEVGAKSQIIHPESYAAQMTAIFILEFGVIFHSVFIGLTLAVSGQEFDTLYVVLVFHQTFEGLALGSRLASIPWPKSKKWTPYVLGMGYAISTPIAIAIGLGVRQSYPPNSQTTLIVNGVFDSVSAGILIYTGLVELMAHEFMFSGYMQRAPIREVLGAFGTMCAGAGLMALLGKWA